jgi:hypothetical protein
MDLRAVLANTNQYHCTISKCLMLRKGIVINGFGTSHFLEIN